MYGNVRVSFPAVDVALNDSDTPVHLDVETSNQNVSFDSVVNSQPELKFIDDQSVSLIQPVSLDNSENEYDTKDLLNLFRTPANKTAFISEIPNVIIDDENIIITPGERKTPQSLIND